MTPGPHAFTSRGSRRENVDGTHNVYCTVCSEFITSTFQPIRTAICELCQRVQNGQPLTEDAILQYKMSKGIKQDVTLLVVPPPEPQIKGQRKFNIHAMVGGFLQALGFRDLEDNSEQAKVSKPLANSKRRPRLFSNITLGKPEDKEK